MPKTATNSSFHDAEAIMRYLRTKQRVPEGVWRLMLLPYLAPGRHYHNARHILRMIEVKNETPIPFESYDDDSALEWMILGHDWHYKIGGKRGDNENISAEETRKMLVELGMDSWICRVVPLGIRCTIDHRIPKYVDARDRLVIGTLLDLDLMGLGREPEYFAENTEKIWLEFMPIMTREVFDAGQAGWARSFLERDHIYHTSAFKHLEDQARENLKRLASSPR